MAWTDGFDYSTGQLISATIWNNYLGEEGDIDLTAPGVVTTAGDVVYATGDNVIARLAIGNGGTVLSSTGSAVQWGLTLTNSITAGSTQTQAGATALSTAICRITVSGTDGDGVKLPTAVAGLEVLILNADSAQTIQVWPNTSDAIDGGSANAVDSNALPAGLTRRYTALDTTNWYTASFSGVPSDVVAYRASSASTPSGWSEYTTVRGRVVVGLISGGTDGATVGTAFDTDSQDKTHTHTGPSHSHILALGGAHPSESVRVDDVYGISGDASLWVRGGATTDTNEKDQNLTHVGGDTNTGNAATSDVLAYIQLMAIKSD